MLRITIEFFPGGSVHRKRTIAAADVASGFDGDRRVVVRGYEEGVDDILPPRAVQIALDAHDEDWNGPHGTVVVGGEPAVLIAGVKPR